MARLPTNPETTASSLGRLDPYLAPPAALKKNSIYNTRHLKPRLSSPLHAQGARKSPRGERGTRHRRAPSAAAAEAPTEARKRNEERRPCKAGEALGRRARHRFAFPRVQTRPHVATPYPTHPRSGLTTQLWPCRDPRKQAARARPFISRPPGAGCSGVSLQAWLQGRRRRRRLRRQSGRRRRRSRPPTAQRDRKAARCRRPLPPLRAPVGC